MCDRCRDKYRRDNNELFWESWGRLLSSEETLLSECSPGRAALWCKLSLYLNLKEEPRVKSTGLGLGLGSSKRRKKAWYSTQIFQKTLQQSLLAIRNSRVSWYELCGAQKNITYQTQHWQVLHFTVWLRELTFRSGLSLMRKRFLLKLSLRTLDQLKALIFMCPCSD